MNCIKLQLLGISVQFFVDRQIANVIKKQCKNDYSGDNVHIEYTRIQNK